MGREGWRVLYGQRDRSKRKLVATFRVTYGRGHCTVWREREIARWKVREAKRRGEKDGEETRKEEGR